MRRGSPRAGGAAAQGRAAGPGTDLQVAVFRRCRYSRAMTTAYALLLATLTSLALLAGLLLRLAR
jgi:hypothetical protein